MNSVASGLRRELGAAVLDGEAELLAYAYDGALDRARPDAVLLARRAADVERAVSWCAARGVPFVARGAGTNLCGASIPLRGGVVLALAGMDRILAISEEGAVAEPGVVNLRLQAELERRGRFYAPDPASFRVCTLGGNVAQNAGGPRCLKYGVTSDHVTGLDAVMPDGTTASFSVDDPGPDLVGVLVGAEGTLGVVTRIRARTLPSPKAIVTVLAGFPSIEASIECVSAIIASGIVPRVLEAMDRMTVESIEAYRPSGYPRSEAVLLIEVDGDRAEADAAAVEAHCRRHGAAELRRAVSAAEREKLWEGRRGAYAAVARIAPNVLVEDGVVPRGRLPEAVRRVRAIAREARLTVPLLFHAGDGNLHPNIAYDERDAAQTRRVKHAGHEILRACVELEGSISGEHGVGADKRAAMAWLFTPETLALFKRVKRAFDPAGLSNPEKLFPSAEPEKSIAPARPLSAEAERLLAAVREARADGAAIGIRGRGTKLSVGDVERPVRWVETPALRSIRDLDRSNFTVTVEAGVGVSELRAALAAEGFHLPLGSGRGSLGGAIASKELAGLRENVIGVRAALASGEVVQLGGKVVKNVAGYDLTKALLGSWGAYAIVLEVTLRLSARPIEPGPEGSRLAARFSPNRWHRALKQAFDPDNRLNPWVFA